MKRWSLEQEKIIAVCDSIKRLLLTKNEKYGNAALEPLGIFLKEGDVVGLGLKARIEDKLKRYRTMTTDDEDTLQDLIGYLILLKIHLDGNKTSLDSSERLFNRKAAPDSYWNSTPKDFKWPTKGTHRSDSDSGDKGEGGAEEGFTYSFV